LTTVARGFHSGCLPFGLTRMESKNFDESIGMTNFDYAMQKPSSLDIAISLKPVAEASLRRS
jgi:hypothetical protein